MPRRPTGTVETFFDSEGKSYYRGRVRLGDGSREWIDIPDRHQKSKETAKKFVAIAQARELKDGQLLAEKRARIAKVPIEGETVEEFAEKRWEPARAARGVTGTKDHIGQMKLHVWPIIGKWHAAAVTTSQVEDVRDALDVKVRSEAMRWKTARNIWSFVTTMFDDMKNAKERALRIRTDDPTVGVRPPDRGEDLAKTYLYPDEFLQLVRCEEVSLRLRQAFTIAIYIYARHGELSALEVGSSVDLVRGVASIVEQVNRNTGKRKATKTKVTRTVPIEENLLPLLRVFEDEGPRRGVTRILPCIEKEMSLSKLLRECLVKAGVTRKALHGTTATTKQISFHDLRATGITWAAVRGDDPMKIKQRAGHKHFSTTEKYIREAENLRGNFGDVFPPLPEGLIVWPNDWPKRSRKIARLTEKMRQTMAFDLRDSNPTLGDGKPDVPENIDRFEEAFLAEVLGLEPDADVFGPGLGQTFATVSDGDQGPAARSKVARRRGRRTP